VRISQLMSFALSLLFFFFHDSQITNYGLCVFLFPLLFFLYFFYLASLPASLLPCSSFYIDPYLASLPISATTLSYPTLSLCRVQLLKVFFSYCMSFSLAFLSILLLPRFSSCFSPTLLFVLYRPLPCFSFYISYYLVLPYLVLLSRSPVKKK